MTNVTISTGAGSPVLTNTTPELRRAWHCVAESTEVGDEPVQVWLLGEPWVLVRLDGEVHAYVDRCPHRLAPLSIGTVVQGGDGAELQCGYHGWRFGGDGGCTAIPALGEGATLPSKARLTAAHSVAERFGLVFVAPEEPFVDLPDDRYWSDATFEQARCASVRTSAGAAQLVDNFMDAAHFPYVHGATFGVADDPTLEGGDLIEDGNTVRAAFASPYRNVDDPLVETGEHPLVQPHEVLTIGRADLVVELELSFELTGGRFWILYAVTPETADRTRVYKVIARNDVAHDPGRIEQVVKDEDVILAEDVAIMETFPHRELALDLRGEVHTKVDKLSVAWRRLMLRTLFDAPVD